MRKYIIFIIGLIIVVAIALSVFLYITLKLDTIQCKNSIREEDYTINNIYKIYYKNEIVKKVRIEKEIVSKNNTVLSFFLKNYEDEYKGYQKEYGGYKISTKDGKNKKTLILDWDLSKVNFDKLLEGRSYLKNTIKNKKMDIEGVYKLFQLNKNSCK